MIRLGWPVAVLLLAACSSAVAEPVADRAGADASVGVEALVAVPELTVESSTEPSDSVLTTTTASTVAYSYAVLPIDGEVRDRVVGTSWREGCPLSLEELRYLTVSYVDFDGEVRTGELIVAEVVAAEVVEIFRDLFEIAFPIERIQLVSDFGADDLESMLANNTSGFNCRFVEGTQRWSEHAFGQAIDVNPLINPWVKGSVVSPVAGAEFADRTVQHKGGLYKGSAAVAAFEGAGWVWGGSWQSTKDYQHFSTTGR